MENEMENEMDIWGIQGLCTDPSIQKRSTLGPKACEYWLHQTIWIPQF